VDLPHLVTDRLVLRLAALADVGALLRFHADNLDHLAATSPPPPPRGGDWLTDPHWRLRVIEAEAEFAADISVRLLAFRRDDPGRVVGQVNFSQIFRRAFQSCVLGYALDHREQGHGLMTEAVRAGVEYVFGPERNLHRIAAAHLPDNARSAAVLARCGFAVEGLARDYLFIAGRWRDHVLTARTNPAWRPPST